MGVRFKEIAGIFLISILLGVLYNSYSADGLPLVSFEYDVSDDVEIDLHSAKMVWLKKQALFIDARSSEAYKAGHISRALNIPLSGNRSEKLLAVGKIPKDRLLIVYCQDEQCNQAERLSGQLALMGFRNIKIFSAGWLAWQETGLPYEKTDNQ